jgi:hypothetical protein
MDSEQLERNQTGKSMAGCVGQVISDPSNALGRGGYIFIPFDFVSLVIR